MPQTYLTIEGTRTPSVQLATGARVTVVDTPEVRRRVALGYVKIVNEITQYDDEESGGGVQAPSVNALEPPAKNASKAEWIEFLAAIGLEAANADMTKVELIDYYEQWAAAQTVPTE